MVPPFARSLGTLLRLLGRPVSMPLLLSGILGGPSVNSPEACLRAARRWGLDGRIVHRKSLSDISSLVLPCILLLAGGRSCVLLSRDAETAEVVLPEEGEHAKRVPLADLEVEYTATRPSAASPAAGRPRQSAPARDQTLVLGRHRPLPAPV